MGNPLIVFLLIIFIGLAGAQAPDESPFERVKRFFVKFDAVIETGDLTKISPLFSDEFLLEHCEALTFKQNLLQAISDYAEEQKKIYIKPVGAKKLDNSLIEITAQFGYLHSQEELEAFGFQSTWILHTTRDQLISGKAYCFVASTPTARPSNQATALTTSTTWTPSYSPTTVNPSDLTTRYWHETDDKSTVDWIIVNQLIELDHARTAANISALERLIDRNTDYALRLNLQLSTAVPYIKFFGSFDLREYSVIFRCSIAHCPDQVL
uniref:FTP domain-containing protein n=1 Tax=Caenorhabditis tropicalis TaxID=1561998 RepID=A0A1I7TRK9_9PELO